MLFGPVFNAELTTTARRARYYVLRTVYGVILLYFICQNAFMVQSYVRSASGEVSPHEMSLLGGALFSTLFAVQSAAILLLTPALVAGVIAEEKQRRTLQYLLASRLSSVEIVGGKLAARLLHVAVFLAIALPITSLVSLFGGVDPLDIVLVFAGSITTAFFLAALSVLVSTQARRPREATTVVYLVEVVWLFGPLILSLSLPGSGPLGMRIYGWIRPLLDWIGPTSPFYLLNNLARGWEGALEPFLWMAGLQVAGAIGLVALAVVRLRPRFRRESDGAGRAWQRTLRRARRILPRPECGDDPILWKERYVSRTGLATKLAAVLVCLAAGGLLVGIAYGYAKPAFIELAAYGYGAPGVQTARFEFNACLRAICTTVFCILGVGVAVAASSSMTSEREEDTWTSLVVTPLGSWEIVRAKMIGAFWSVRWMSALLGAFWLTGVAAGAVHPLGFVAVFLETTVFVWFATALGTCISVRSRTSGRALLGTVATLIMLNGAYLMCCFPVGSRVSWIIGIGVTPLIEALSLLSYEDVGWFLSQTSQSMSVDRFEEAAVTCFFGTFGYAAAAAGLTQYAVVRFEQEAGRPRRAGAGAVPSRAAIQFLDEPEGQADDVPAADKPEGEPDLG